MDLKLHDYQQYSVNFIMDHNNCGLFLEMGLGKTISTLTAIDNLIFLEEVHKVLVIAPLRVAESTWSNEIDKWNMNLTVSKILGTEKQRIEAINTNADIYIINRDNVKWLVDNYFKTWKFDMVVIDELSSFKSSKSQRFRALRKVRGKVKRLVGLTGTPASNGMMDLWSQIYLLDAGERLGKTLTMYRDTYFKPGKRNGHIIFEYKLRDGAEEQIYSRIGDICVSMKSQDHIKLPERIDNIIEVELKDEAMSRYRRLEDELILEIDDSDITASNAAVLTNKLLQMSNGAIYDESKNVVEIHDEKLKALLDIIEAANGNPVLVFYTYKHDLDRIQKYLFDNKIKSELLDKDNIAKWNDGKIDVLLVQPQSAAYGLNIQSGGHIIVWFSPIYSLELYQQANARLYRQGQKDTVIINHICCKNTIDIDVMKALDGKCINQDLLLEAIKARVKR